MASSYLDFREASSKVLRYGERWLLQLSLDHIMFSKIDFPSITEHSVLYARKENQCELLWSNVYCLQMFGYWEIDHRWKNKKAYKVMFEQGPKYIQRIIFINFSSRKRMKMWIYQWIHTNIKCTLMLLNSNICQHQIEIS